MGAGKLWASNSCPVIPGICFIVRTRCSASEAPMANYFVIGADGQMYGPADEATLAGWAQQGRLTAQSTLQDAATNQRVYASQVPAIAGAFAPAPAPASPYQQQAAYQQQQTAMPMPGAYGYQQPAYQQPAAYQQPMAQAPL